jgi:hypothetical protein
VYVLVPDDPVFFAKFQSLEEPLLGSLYMLHSAGPESDDERVIADAYDSWLQVLLKLPLWFDSHTAGTSTGTPAGYVLYGPRGDQLTSLYPIEVTAVDLGHLTACRDLFTVVRDGVPEQGMGLADTFRRVMEVLLLPPPDALLGTLRHVVPGETVVPVTLPAEQETEYRRFCEDIVTILSSGDAFAYRSHRAMYP